MDETDAEGLSRRGFLRAATTGGAVAAASGAASGTASAQTTHTVEMNDKLKFAPAEITIAPGDTVEWPNVGNVGHSVTAYGDKIPEGATYFASGGFKSESAARKGWPKGEIAGGEKYSHTFETAGTYEYFCIPHESAGMVGTITVEKGGGGGGGGEGGGPAVPNSARTLVVATMAALVATLALAYVFLKYGGPGAAEE